MIKDSRRLRVHMMCAMITRQETTDVQLVISMDVASAFDSVRADILGDVLLERGASAFSAATVVRENLELRCRPCLGHTQCAPLSLDVGLRHGGPRTPSGWNQLVAFLVEEILLLWSDRYPAVSWAPEWKTTYLLKSWWGPTTYLKP